MLKRGIYILFIALLFNGNIFSQSPRYWTQSAGGSIDDEGYDIAVDDSNNVYTTGYFTGTADFVNNVANTFSLHSAGTRDIFICKNDTTGKYLWAVKAGGSYVDRGNAIKTDHLGNVYVTGYFSNTAAFGGVQLTSHGSQDVFVAKYNTNGILQWVRNAGGSLNDAGNGIAIDDNGNVIVTGQFIDTAFFGSFTLISQIDSFTSIPSVDVFTVKYDSTGNVLWAKKGSSQFTDRGLDIGCDHQGNIFVTGQFSDTITFDNTYNNSIYNAIFLVKYDSNGNEQWFRKAGGGTKNIAYGLAVNDTGNIFLTGDFKGHVIFFGTPSTNLTTTFNEGIFAAKYNNAGDLLWASSSGSDNEITSRNIALDDSSNAYIVGNFKCVFSEYSNHYGTGCFNSAGYNDIYISKFNSSGQWKWARNYGGINEDYGRSICVNHFSQPIFTGGIEKYLTIPYLNNFNFTWGTLWNFNGPLHSINCNDSSRYDKTKWSEGMHDIVISNPFDPRIPPFYFYDTNNDTNCTRPSMGVKIRAGSFPDTVEFCGQGQLDATTFTSNLPFYNYLWVGGGGGTNPNVTVYTSGMRTVTITSADGCYTSSDSVYVIIHPLPPKQLISDSKGINNHTNTPVNIQLCRPDSVIITANYSGNDSIYWTGLGTASDTNFTFFTQPGQSGQYAVILHNVDSNGCGNFTNIYIDVDTAIRNIIPKIKLWDSVNDTVTICLGKKVRLNIYDSITDPTGINICNSVLNQTNIQWQITPAAMFTSNCNGYIYISISPVQPGAYHISALCINSSVCGGNDTFLLTKDFYLIINPLPVVSVTITGDSLLCTGDSAILTASPSQNYSWTAFPGVIHGTHDSSSVQIFGPGVYNVEVTDTSIFGCINTGMNNYYVSGPVQPMISMIPSDGLICPGDSVQLIASNSGSYSWQGPAGPIGGNNSLIYATTPGEYYCIVDSASCSDASNTLDVEQYSTPFLFATPSTVICPGLSVEVDVITNIGSIIQWQPPLSGNNPIQLISTPGVYSCDITSCGILTQSSVALFMSNVSAVISGPLSFCPGDSATLTANQGMALYEWQPNNTIDPFLVVNQSGNYTLTTTDGYGCTASASVNVNANLNIPVPNLFSMSPLCSGDSIYLYSDADTSLNFQWTGPNGFSSNLFEPVIHNITTADSGIYTLTVSQASCTNSSTIYVAIDSMQSITISLTAFPCINSIDTLSATIVPGAFYAWTLPNLATVYASDIYFPSLQYSDSGIYNLVVTNGNCVANLNYHLSVVNTIPIPLLSSNSPICSGDTLHLSSNASAGLIYQWTGPNGFTSGIAAPAIPNAATVDSGTYSLTVSQGTCINNSSIHVVIDSLPNIMITASGTMCINSPLSLIASSAAGASYSWTSPGGINYTSNEIDFTSVQYSDTGIYHLTVTRGFCIVILNYHLSGLIGIQSPVISSNSPICSGDTLKLHTNLPVSLNYVWTGPNGYSSTLPAIVIPNTVSADSGTYAVTVSQGACTNSASTNISIDSLPDAAISVSSPLCINSAADIAAANIPGVTYSWNTPTGVNYSGNEIIITALQYTDTGIYHLSFSKGSCNKTSSVVLSAEDCDFDIPNVFTPNHDGKNDFFEVDKVDIESIVCKIFNRWGRLIYTWDSPNGHWDGTDENSGRQASSGVYYYIMEIKLYNRESLSFKGTVELIGN